MAPGSLTDRLWRLLALTLAAITCLYVSLVQTSGNDFWLQAKIGEMVMTQHAIPDTLLFPYTEVTSQAFHAHEWLASIAFHLCIAAWGEVGLPFVTALLGLGFFALVCKLAYVRSEGNFGLALLCAILAVAAENYRQALRPELLSLLVMVFYWLQLERFKTNGNGWHAAAALVAVVLWANLHGSFVLAPVMVGIYALGSHLDGMRAQQSWRARPALHTWRWLALGAASCLACLLNPSGTELLAFVFRLGNDTDLRRLIAEWEPTLQLKWLHLPGVWLAGFAWAVTLGVLIAHRKRLHASDILFFVFFSLLALKAIRFLVYLGIVGAYLVARYAPAAWKLQSQQRWLNISASVLSLLASLQYGNAFGYRPYTPGYTRFSPGMVKTLRDVQYRGNVLNSFALGSELVYLAYPRLQPSIDARIDSYGAQYVEYQIALLNDDALLAEFVQRYDVRYLLIDPVTFEQCQKHVSWRTQQWGLVYRDNSAVFLQRI
jgi:hypothetical protein